LIEDKKNYLVVLAGPTAVGKTALSIEIAGNLQCEILSADSRQFFKELSIGTAKPSKVELQKVKHHFVDYISISEEFSAGRFETECLELLSELFQKQSVALMTGGSGLYIQAVSQGMNEIPQVDIQFRHLLYSELTSHGLLPLLEELKAKDPIYFQQVDRSNPQRVIRALEVCRSTGQPYSAFRKDIKLRRDFEIIKIGLDRERKELYGRINERVDSMVNAGLFEEAKMYQKFRHLNALKTVGYREAYAYFEGTISKEESIRLIKRNSRRYARRQLTWFRKDPEYQWFHPENHKGILKYIKTRMGQ
jgi:tRNA dimethylallyltransferase